MIFILRFEDIYLFFLQYCEWRVAHFFWPRIHSAKLTQTGAMTQRNENPIQVLGITGKFPKLYLKFQVRTKQTFGACMDCHQLSLASTVLWLAQDGGYTDFSLYRCTALPCSRVLSTSGADFQGSCRDYAYQFPVLKSRVKAGEGKLACKPLA